VIVQAPVVDLAYPVTSICQGSAPILPSIASPAGGVFSDANQAGTTNPVTGAFNPSLATPGLHTLGYVFAGACTGHDWFTINVVAPSSPGTNGAMTVCSNDPSQSLMAFLGGSPASGGTWSGPSPVSGNTYAPSTMAPGLYTYTIAANAPCPATSASVLVTETPAQAWFADTDGDGFGDAGASVMACSPPAGHVLNATDLCPNDPLKQTPGNCGCGVPETGCLDCAGVPNGSAVLDNCGTCVGGTTGNTPCTADCAGVFGGSAVIDNCGTCVGGTTGNTPCTADCDREF
jgi:hypothetical protein